jgi:hypothetical protein
MCGSSIEMCYCWRTDAEVGKVGCRKNNHWLCEYKIDICVRFVMSDYQCDPLPRLSWHELGYATCLLPCDVQVWKLWGDGRRWGEGQVETCRTDGLEAVTDRHDAWTEGSGDRMTSRGNWHLGHQQLRVYMRVTRLTESRRRTCESSEAQKNLGSWPFEDGDDTCRVGFSHALVFLEW